MPENQVNLIPLDDRGVIEHLARRLRDAVKRLQADEEVDPTLLSEFEDIAQIALLATGLADQSPADGFVCNALVTIEDQPEEVGLYMTSFAANGRPCIEAKRANGERVLLTRNPDNEESDEIEVWVFEKVWRELVSQGVLVRVFFGRTDNGLHRAVLSAQAVQAWEASDGWVGIRHEQ